LDWKKGLCKREEICLLESAMVVELDERENRERERERGVRPWSCNVIVPKMQRGQAIRVSETVKKKVWQRYR
jgi:tetrahydromethanopterin S-methyltransferase subunit A